MKKTLPYSLLALKLSCPHQDEKFNSFTKDGKGGGEIEFQPARVLMQDFTGVPAVVDLAAMRDAVMKMGKDPSVINPQVPVDLVIDHSVVVDKFGNETAFQENVGIEVERNHERYAFLKWSQQAFSGLRVVPPGTGICHQVNLEYLAQVVCDRDGNLVPDTVVGTDSHTTMVNGLGVLGWGVGGIEAEAAMLGQPISMNIPQVIGVQLVGKWPEGITATDLVLTITQLLREKGVVGKFVEFFGDGVQRLSLAERATIANMAPEYGATVGMFPVDDETLNYLRLTGRSEDHIQQIKEYLISQSMWDKANDDSVVYSDTLKVNLADIRPCLAGPKRPQDRAELSQVKQQMQDLIAGRKSLEGKDGLQHGDVVIAAITSCTNTSNPAVLVAAGLLARNAVAKGLKVPAHVKTSLAPGSKVVTAYLDELGLTQDFNALGFHNVGYGCTTCIGNSGPLDAALVDEIVKNEVLTSSVLSGNRNFEGRIHPYSEANWLASPPLVVAYALAGTTLIDMENEPLGVGNDGQPVYLKDIWPKDELIFESIRTVRKELFMREYDDVFSGGVDWAVIPVDDAKVYHWNDASTYIRQPAFFDRAVEHTDLKGARVLALLGDSVTTDHISPAGVIKHDSPAGSYLEGQGVLARDFNSYGSRRGNYEVMVRGTFANIKIRNKMVPGVTGGYTKHFPSGDVLSIYEAASRYQSENIPTVVVAGKEYGTGSSRDWAAKGTLLQGVKVVIAESFERIHRSNLIGMGVLPCQFLPGQSAETLQLTGDEKMTILGIASLTEVGQLLELVIERASGEKVKAQLTARLDTENEIRYFQSGGILNYVISNLVK